MSDEGRTANELPRRRGSSVWLRQGWGIRFLSFGILVDAASRRVVAHHTQATLCVPSKRREWAAAFVSSRRIGPWSGQVTHTPALPANRRQNDVAACAAW